MKDRLLQLLAEEKMTSMKFAEIMEVQPSNISHILSGRNNPGFEFIARLLRRFPEINPDWLINGDGGMYRFSIPGTHLKPFEQPPTPLASLQQEVETAIDTTIDAATPVLQLQQSDDAPQAPVNESQPSEPQLVMPAPPVPNTDSESQPSEPQLVMPAPPVSNTDSESQQAKAKHPQQANPAKIAILYDDNTFEYYNYRSR